MISRAIDSALSQSFSDLELIIVDDGSQDNTKTVVEKYKLVDKRVIYIYKENGGQNSALNVGLKCARGKYIAFLDSDDFWLSGKLEKVYNKFQEDQEFGLVYHQTGIIKRGGIKPGKTACLEGYIYGKVLRQEFLSAPTSLAVKKECMEEVHGFDECFVMFQDDDICFTLTKRYKVGLVKEILSIVGREADQRVTGDYLKAAQDYMKLIDKYQYDVVEYCGEEKLAQMYY